jgi:small multidrug resistance pump
MAISQSWLWLLLGIALEISGTTAMKLAAGFTKPLPSIAVFAFYGLSLVSVTLALRGMQISLAYAVWSALGTGAIAVIGCLAFQESLTPPRLASFALIILGVVGLNLTTGSTDRWGNALDATIDLRPVTRLSSLATGLDAAVMLPSSYGPVPIAPSPPAPVRESGLQRWLAPTPPDPSVKHASEASAARTQRPVRTERPDGGHRS